MSGPSPTVRTRTEPLATCEVCHLPKRPYGRSVPVEAENSHCGWNCRGYTESPHAGYDWPEEATHS